MSDTNRTTSPFAFIISTTTLNTKISPSKCDKNGTKKMARANLAMNILQAHEQIRQTAGQIQPIGCKLATFTLSI
ncbi:hypothetical protein [Novosphingobium album (ex Liu et al. 2023)]|uniref:hypothetical protein n=1 Tax=Novosphingobium album (ex Liu et al. 2023) TaxID=3031130 RepID=UPI0023B05C57|nr:hypothetical protein [Novosphingobium album (ex Liu et al. 2023)]